MVMEHEDLDIIAFKYPIYQHADSALLMCLLADILQMSHTCLSFMHVVVRFVPKEQLSKIGERDLCRELCRHTSISSKLRPFVST